jgi:hypothetical protein
MKRSAVLLLLPLVIVPSCHADQPGLVDLSKIERSIAKEPVYQSEPHYALLVFGPQAAHRSWMVMDGNDVMYLDRNGNGDLTEPEERMELDREATMKVGIAEGSGYSGLNVFQIGAVAGVKLRFDFWVRKRDYVPKDEWERNIMRERAVNHWENGTLLKIAADGSQVQNPLLMATKPGDAQITHFDGPLTFGLRSGTGQKLKPWPESTTFDVRIGTPALSPRNYPRRLFSPLGVSELPADVHPNAVFEYTAKKPGDAPIVQTVKIDNRCCGDSLYASISVPREAGEGVARVSLTYVTDGKLFVHPATFEVPVGGQRNSLDSETSYVMFNDLGGSIGHDEAMVALRVAGLNVQKVPGQEAATLRVQVVNRPIFTIALNRKGEVRDVASALAEGSPFAKALGQCNARFDVFRFPDRSDFKEKELSIIHKVLQEETQGVIYTPWDKRLSAAD